MIKVVLFDFYGVFIADSYGLWLEKNDLKREGVFARLIDELDRSAVTEAHFLSQLSKLLDREVQSSEIHIQHPEPDARLIELVHKLKLRYTIGLFSNASTKLRAKLEGLHLTPLFDEIIISSEIGHAKPSNEAFQIAIQKLGVRPNEILFIDDNMHNVEAANRNGMQAVQYTTIDDIHLTLKSHQIV